MPHTPGPWKVLTTIVEGGEYPGIYRHNAAEQWGKPPIATLRQDYPDREANARLIAAAPDLLEAMRRLLTETGSLPLPAPDENLETAYRLAWEAYRKATGQ